MFSGFKELWQDEELLLISKSLISIVAVLLVPFVVSFRLGWRMGSWVSEKIAYKIEGF